MASRVVHHYFPLGSQNVGDLLVARAIRAAVQRHFGPCSFVDFPVNDRYRGNDRLLGLRGANVDRSNAEADLVIVGGSNLLEPRKPRRTGPLAPLRGDWGVFTDVESIERLTPPLLLLGMGTGSSFAKRIRKYYPPASDQVRALHRKSFAAAVRDQVTVEKLAALGVKVQCTGCPVTFLTDRPVSSSPVSHERPLLVSFPPPRITQRFGGSAFMGAAMRYVQWLQDRKIPTVVTLHDLADVEPAKKWVPAGVEVFCTENLDRLIERFEASAGVVGFRLHAALLGMGVGKPIIPVGVDWRGIAFQQTFGLDDLAIRALRPGQFSKLRRLTERLLSQEPKQTRRLADAKQQFHGRYHSFLAAAAATFAKLPAPSIINAK